jgi:hypothetical protein
MEEHPILIDWQDQYVTMARLSKAIYMFSVIPTKIPMIFFRKIFIWKYQNTLKGKIIYE